MNVLFISRATLRSTPGGDTVQMEKTAAALQKHGVTVTISLADEKIRDYKSFDLIHFFNIIRPADILLHIRKSRLPFLVSPVYVEYKEQEYNGSPLSGQNILGVFSANSREYLKCIARMIKNGEQIVSPEYLVMGHKRSIRYILKRCSLLLPNSESEYRRLSTDFKTAGAYAVIPNAVDTALFYPEANPVRPENTVLCVARFEPRKNQLNLIRALSGTDWQLTLAGNVAPNHQGYYEQCRAAAGDNVRFVDFLPQEALPEVYRQHKVHVLASWFETTGLSSLEAAACGCNIVVSDKGDTRDYFSENAFYCHPGSPETILNAVVNASRAGENTAFLQEIAQTYCWENTAKRTLEAYRRVAGI